MRIAVAGCVDGELDTTYKTLQDMEKKNNYKIDLLLCCGDFEAVRNENDLKNMNAPKKYQTMKSFWKYYSGLEIAPILTIFIGGNHEASNYMWELYYGGWAAPNIYFLGFAGVIKFGDIRIGGLSGIYNPRNYHLGWGYSKKTRKREREEEKRSRLCRSPSLPLAVAAARRSPSLPLAFAAASLCSRSQLLPLAPLLPSLLLTVESNSSCRRCRKREKGREEIAASPSLSVAVDRHQSHLSPSRSVGVDRLCLESEFEDVWARFMAGGFDQPKDGLKMALVLIANNVLFGQDLRRKATLWLFQMVEDLEAFSSFPWGSYVYMMTIHYLRQGFRSANAPLKHIVHYNLYGFPWALEIWAMEAFGSLIDLVGKNLGHRHPRLKNWRIFKRPHDFFGKFAKYEKEMGDDSTDSSRIIRKVMSAMSDRFEDIVKEIKKEISAMEDRLNARLTRVEASLAQLSTPEVQEDHVGGPNVGGDGTVGKGVGKGDANRTEAFDGGDGTVGNGVGEGDATLTEALDGGDGTVGKGVSRGNGRHGRGDTDQGGPDSTLGGGDGTFSEGIVGGDDTHSKGLQIVVHNILLHEGIVVQSHPPSEDDSTMVDYLALKNEREQRLKITSRYMNSPYIDPFQAPDKEKQKLKTDYSRYKRSRKDAALNVGTDYYATKQFFVEMESPTCWLSNEVSDLKIYNSEWKKFQPYEDAPLTGEFDALSYKCPTDWLLYASSDKPGWGTCWSSVRYLFVPCAVGDPDGHWILCVIDLEK
ncbi:hypothetical protein Dsin_029131 [Dipteronia sinensis]|uniref:Calcineurin-like phosphoesterase domain-containing protein n=1 Tax=Dipteronia sinensis TaxID=43782 RepID=A0AAD9ZRW2_9ROSI|nr:hypothetical protein Dsin_029131 [Dipteronia sinensis]